MKNFEVEKILIFKNFLKIKINGYWITSFPSKEGKLVIEKILSSEGSEDDSSNDKKESIEI